MIDAHDDEFYDENCPKSPDGQHCNCWYDDEPCHYCQVENNNKHERTENNLGIRKGSTEL